MADNNTILEKLEGLIARFEEVSTLITDPNVIADQARYVKLTKAASAYQSPIRLISMKTSSPNFMHSMTTGPCPAGAVQRNAA